MADTRKPSVLLIVVDQLRADAPGFARGLGAVPPNLDRLAARGILYAPDYVINAGGIISVMAEYFAKTEGHKVTLADVNAQVDAIGPRLAALFKDADSSGLATHVVADRTAQSLIGR